MRFNTSSNILLPRGFYFSLYAELQIRKASLPGHDVIKTLQYGSALSRPKADIFKEVS